jgi:uncharacterized protein YoxC
MFYLIIFLLLSLIFLFLSVIFSNSKVYKEYKNIKKDSFDLISKNTELKQKNDNIEIKNNEIEKELNNKLKKIEEVRQTVNEITSMSEEAFKNYYNLLEKKYIECEEEYEQNIKNLEIDFSEKQSELSQELQKTKADLDKIKATRAALIQAQLKEKEIKEKSDFYCLAIDKNDLADIKVLKEVRSRLHNERVLNMLIWQSYYQKPMTALCNNIIGTERTCGIYKITNQLNDICYIGKSVDISTRWKQHAKCGLGIDTPAGNKLYKAMQEDGLYNFSFEIIEKCSKDELSEKEKYYIQLYQSKDYGYNSVEGNS